MKKLTLFSCLSLFAAAILCGASLIALTGVWNYLRPAPNTVTQKLFEGIVYQRDVRSEPRPIIVHVIRVNLRSENIRIQVTPGNPQEELPLSARTTSEFLQEFDLQIAINGDGFTPWYSRTLLKYYPHSGDPVDVIGQAVANGTRYSVGTDNEPTLYFNRNNQARINQSPGRAYQAISGNLLLVQQGRPEPEAEGTLEPRTAVGLDQRRNELILVVADGRQPGYSEGVTLHELAQIMISLGAYEAINLDGGGSSTMVVEGANGRAKVLNSPINHGLPGLQRPVANHLGIFVTQKDN
jgi:hypothetical protein